MEINNICLGCMTDKGNAEVCPKCGWREGTASDPQCLPPGTVLNGQYLVGKSLGRGGFGITYLAWDLNLNVKLAIKEYLPESFATRSPGSDMVSAFSGEMGKQYSYGLEKFLDEAKAVAQFNGHPNIVAVRNFFRENGTAYFVMDYIEGQTFKKYIEGKGGRVSFDETVKIMTQVMDALKEVHEKGMLHRDISPDNVYLTKNGQVKVLDFGAARNAVGENNKSISVILKPGYAPEEQYRSKGKQGPWTDVYAVGATVYRAIVGQVPPESLDRMERDDLQQPSRFGVVLPPYAEAAIIKALAIRAADRFQTMEQFQNAITGKQADTASQQDVVFVNCPSCGTSNKVPRQRWTDISAKAFCSKCGSSMKASSLQQPPGAVSSPNSYRPSQMNVPPPSPYQQVPPSPVQANSYRPSQMNVPPVNQYQQSQMSSPNVNSYSPVTPNAPQVNSYRPQNESTPIVLQNQGQQMGIPAANQYQYGQSNSFTNIRYAGFWNRFLAMVLDGFIFGIPFYIVLPKKSVSASGGPAFAIIILLYAAIWGIFAAFESSKLMATPGKKAMGIIVTDLNGNRVSFGRAFGRNAAKLLSYIIILIGFLMAGLSSKKQGLHDMITGCLVIKKKQF